MRTVPSPATVLPVWAPHDGYVLMLFADIGPDITGMVRVEALPVELMPSPRPLGIEAVQSSPETALVIGKDDVV